MAKKKSIYEGVSYDILKEELQDSIDYLLQKNVNELKDRIEWKPTKTGGIAPSVISVIEEQIMLQVLTIEKCCRMLKSVFENEEMSKFVQTNIDAMVNKMEEIQIYYRQRPITEITDRFEERTTTDKKGNTKTITFLTNKEESIIKMRTDTTEKILKIRPLVKELENFKETMSIKGGYEIPESMLYD